MQQEQLEEAVQSLAALRKQNISPTLSSRALDRLEDLQQLLYFNRKTLPLSLREEVFSKS